MEPPSTFTHKFTYRLHLMYDGTRYSGWQIQPNAESIQEIVQKAVRTLVKEEVHVIGSGRTDAGVHALDQVAHFRTTSKIEAIEPFCKAMNGILPKDIRLTKMIGATPSFHAQRSAIGKEYHYHICHGHYASPFERFFVWHVPYQLNMELLDQARKLFIGTHDFSSFANSQHHGACQKNPVRTIRKIDIVERPLGFTLQFEGNGFLYKMVRNIVGMLIEVASGKRTIAEVSQILHAKDRRVAGKAAPAQGLFLVKVTYTVDEEEM